MPIIEDFFSKNELPVPKEQESGVNFFVEATIKNLFEANKGNYDALLIGLDEKIKELSPLDEKGHLKRIINLDDVELNQRKALIEYRGQLASYVNSTRITTKVLLEE